MPATGNGLTLSFPTSGFTGQFISADLGEKTLEALLDSHLGTTGNKTYSPDDLTEPGELTGTLFLNATTAEEDLGQVETCTATLPITEGSNTTNATLAGTGFLRRYKRANAQNGELMQCEFTFKWDGKTGPTFTVEAA